MRIDQKSALYVLLLYCAIYYYLPYLVSVFSTYPLEQDFRWQPNYTVTILFVTVFLGVFYIFQKQLARVRFRPISFYLSAYGSRLYAHSIFSLTISMMVCLAHFALSLWSARNLGLGFRHAGLGLSDAGMFALLHVFVGNIAVIYTLVNLRLLFFLKQTRATGQYQALTIYFCFTTAAFFLSIQSAFGVLFFILAATGLVQTLRVKRKRQQTGQKKKGGALRTLLAGAGIAVLIVAMVFVGIANKLGTAAGLAIISNPGFLSEVIVYRIGFHFYSTANAVTSHFFDIELGLKATSEVLRLIQFRMGVVLGFASERPEIGSVARMNFLSMSYEFRDRIGTTPSLLGSLFYWPGGILVFPVFMIILNFFLVRIQVLVLLKNQSLWSYLIAMIVLGAIFDSSVDALNPLSPGFITVITVILGAQRCLYYEKKFQNNAPSYNLETPLSQIYKPRFDLQVARLYNHEKRA